MGIELARGDDALAVLRDSRIRAGWRELAEACPWATGYQRPEFIEPWYDVYAPRFEPVVVYERGPEGAPAGILHLAREKESGRLAVAGDHQAEYHAWLCAPADGDGFAVRALTLLRGSFPTASVKFRYLPPGAPIAWAASDPTLTRLTQLRSHRRPLVRWSDEEGGEASLAKKSNKSRLNRLKRSGEVAVRELRGAAELEHVIDEIAAYYDVRQGAMNDSFPFRDDVLKRRFHLELARSGVLHAAVLTAGPSVAAAILSLRSRGFLSVGVFAYSPFLARHSPGKFLVLLLGKKLAEQGYSYLDLTPGGTWKDRFATAADEVHEAVVEFDRVKAFSSKTKAGMLCVAKTALSRVGLTPDDVRAKVAALRSKLGDAGDKDPALERCEYFLDLVKSTVTRPPGEAARDDLAALLAFQPAPPWTSQREFLGHALDRLSEGEHVYTVAADGRLLHCLWMGERAAGASGEGEARPSAQKSLVISDPFTHPGGQGHGFEKQALLRCLADAAQTRDVRRVYVAITEGDTALRDAAVELGFVPDEPAVHGAPPAPLPTLASPDRKTSARPAERRPAGKTREIVHSDS